MSSLFPDTNPAAEALLIRLLREAMPWRKLEAELGISDLLQKAFMEAT